MTIEINDPKIEDIFINEFNFGSGVEYALLTSNNINNSLFAKVTTRYKYL